jgi:hypothetical protein
MGVACVHTCLARRELALAKSGVELRRLADFRSFPITLQQPQGTARRPVEAACRPLVERGFCHSQGNFTFVPSMTTIAKTKRYIGCKSVRSIIARMSDKAIKTRTTTNHGFLMADLL